MGFHMHPSCTGVSSTPSLSVFIIKSAYFCSICFFQVCVIHEISFVFLSASISVDSVAFRNLSVSSKSFYS